ncbi:MAG: cellulase family glycosylhydrolase [Kiritimatiellae bacterium]|nr:cellulase family glycosylhydrolase [Kiritimatiellia bacterium]
MRALLGVSRNSLNVVSILLGLVIGAAWLCILHSYASLTPEERAKLRYEELIAEEVLTVGELADVWADEAWTYIQVAIPGATCWTQTKGALPFDPSGFPKDFLDNLIGYYVGESNVPVYEVTIYQDRLNRDICFLNSDDKPIYVIECPYGDYCADDAYALERYPDLYEGGYTTNEIEEIIAHLDPARVLLRVQLIPSDYLYAYLLDEAKGESGGGESEGGEKSGGGTNDFWIAIDGPAQGVSNGVELVVHLLAGFTNQIDIFTFDAETNNMFDGINSDSWVLSVTNQDVTGTNEFRWANEDIEDVWSRFYVAGSSWDQDGDGLASAREIFLHRTDPGLWDTDEDGFSDGDEINTYGTDPLDKYSVPAPEMLSVSDKYLVDESTNPVVLKSVNIGAWLQWEQFMVMFEPFVWTNEWGKIYGLENVDANADDEIDEATAREMLIANVDHSVVLLATNADATSGVEPDHAFAEWLCDTNVWFIGAFGQTNWISFTRDFGDGVSNLAVGCAVPDYAAGQTLHVRLDSPTGTEIGALTTHVTSVDLDYWDEWCAFSEQYITLSANLSGTQTVYFVGSSSVGDMVNLYRFRFFNNATNTEDLFTTFRNSYITTNDLDKIRELGYNCVRLPFFHTLLEDDRNPYVYKQSGWDLLDTFLAECRKRRLWVILDLHSTPGGQDYYQASGFRDPFRNRLWHSEYYQDRTAALWVEIAGRYATNPVVAGYDLFNEPVPYTKGTWTSAQAFSNNIVPMLERLYTAIRSNDASHVLFMESNLMYTNMWSSKDYMWWPSPSAKGWTNVCYEFHVYDRTVYGRTGSDEDSYFTTQKEICDTMIRSFTELRETRNVPVYVGEYAPWNEQNFDYWTRQLQANDFHWGHWNYRSWGWDNPSKPEEGKTLWGLDYRSKDATNEVPDLLNDDLETLAGKIALYNWDNYTDNEPLQDVVGHHASEPELSKGKCEFYLNTFSGQNVQSLMDPHAWPWRKVSAVGPADRFRVQGGRARVYLDTSSLVMRPRSRDEADARFEVDDSVGCHFSVCVNRFSIQTQGSGPEAAVNLCLVRDSISSVVSNYDTRGVIARLVYDDNSSSVDLYLYAKNGGTDSLGTEKAHVGPISFVTNGVLELFVNSTTATLAYAGASYTSVLHGLNLEDWPYGAAGVVEAARAGGGTAEYAELDDFRAWRDDAYMDSAFVEAFTNYPAGVEVRAETEYLSVEDYWAPSRKTGSFVTNDAMFWIPKECAIGQKYGTWMSLRRDYQNPVRLSLTATNVVEVRASYSSFTATGGIAKICIMPEPLPTEIYNEYEGQAVYLELERPTNALKFLVRRHEGTSARQDLQTNYVSFVPGRPVSLQVSTNLLKVYYGSSLVISTNHGLTTITNTYANGAHPHYEVQNNWNTTNDYVLIGGLVCRPLADFTPAED